MKRRLHNGRLWNVRSLQLLGVNTPFQMVICVPISTARPDGM